QMKRLVRLAQMRKAAAEAAVAAISAQKGAALARQRQAQTDAATAISQVLGSDGGALIAAQQVRWADVERDRGRARLDALDAEAQTAETALRKAHGQQQAIEKTTDRMERAARQIAERRHQETEEVSPPVPPPGR
ncbi:MAG: hypothetical protein AAGE76_16780, partial [Pseudomonadota bacterium]